MNAVQVAKGDYVMLSGVQQGRRVRCAVACALISCLAVGESRAEAPREVVRFETSDGVEIVGDYFRPIADKRPAPGVVLVHMLRDDRSSWAPLVPGLHAAGFAVLAIDLRGQGESGTPNLDELRDRVRKQDVAVFHEMDRDVEAAVSWLLARDDVDRTRIALIGATVGFSVALEYADGDASIDVMVGLTPGSGYVGMDSNRGVLLYGKRPMLLLAVDTDRRAVETLARMNSSVVGEIVGTGSGHGTRILTRYDETPARIVSFVSSHIGNSSAVPVVFELGRKQFFKSLERLRADHPDVDASRIRWCSSAIEAGERGLMPAR